MKGFRVKIFTCDTILSIVDNLDGVIRELILPRLGRYTQVGCVAATMITKRRPFAQVDRVDGFWLISTAYLFGLPGIYKGWCDPGSLNLRLCYRNKINS